MAFEHPADLTVLAQQFEHATEFASSPLYRSLAKTVARHESLLRLAARGRPGQYPTFLFFGAVHALLLSGIDHDLAGYYPSVSGADARPPAEAGPALVSFCAAHAPTLAALIESRLVQTNVVKRSLALRLGLVAVGQRVTTPIHLIEIGASAGVLLRCDRYGYSVGGGHAGVPHSPVQITAELRGASAVPNLDAVPALASVTGIDLHPLDARNAEDRRWLEALIWPENRYEAELLGKALALVAADPPRIMAGDAIDVCPVLAASLPSGEPRVAFHSMTRMHVPMNRLDAFDAAIGALGRSGPLYHLSLEGAGELVLREPDGSVRRLARVAGRVEWVEPFDL